MPSLKLSQLPIGLLLLLFLSCFASASPTILARLTKRDPTTNVLRGANFPDPSIITVGGTSYAFGTADGAHQIPTTSNADFNNPSGWGDIIDAFPADGVPAFGDDGWAAPGTTWAPDVNQLTDYDGSFAMYYSPALKSNGGIHCVGVARSGNVQGPYNDSSTEPWVCPQEAGGAIDAAGFLDGNTRYVMYKIDGPAANNGGYCANPNNIVTNTSIMLQQTQADGYTKVGSPVSIWNNQGVSDHYQTEAPTIVRGGDGTYFLFFSTGCYSDGSYTTSYVTSTNIFGPYGNPQILLQNGDYGDYGPGGADITPDGGQMVYHSLINNDISQGRYLSKCNVCQGKAASYILTRSADTATLTLDGQTARIN